MFRSVLFTSLIYSFIGLVYTSFFTFIYPRIKFEASESPDTGEPLKLTPFIANGSLELARNLSQVKLTQRLGVKSYAGFFTVNRKYNSNHYFWYFPPEYENENSPVLLWLQGGPGGSSLFGLFTEIGPITADKNGFKKRSTHWALHYHLLFIDSPVGTGFSFTSTDQGYCRNEECVARDLHCSLRQFFKLFPGIKNNRFFLTGESYAGKYIPTLAMKIHECNKASREKINLQGLAMGNAYCDPVNQLDYGKYLYQLGLLDLQQKMVFENLQGNIKLEILQENWVEADILMEKLMDGDATNSSYFKSFTGFENYYDFLQSNPEDSDITTFANLLKEPSVRKQVHVGHLPFHSGEEVQMYLAKDLLQSVAPLIERLLSHYKIMLYNGQLDIIVAYPLTEEFVRHLHFSSSYEYKKCSRRIWKVDEQIAGYVKVAGNLTEVLVRNAGHMVPHDQPKWAFDMITTFVEGKHFGH